MQQKSPVIHVLQQELKGMVRKLMLRFMQITHVSECEDITEVSIDDNQYYLPLEEVYVGDITSMYLHQEDAISAPMLKKFRETVLAWWHKAVKECIKRLPLGHPLISNLHWLQAGLQQYNLVTQVLAAADCLPQVVQPDCRSLLQEEFMDYCVSPLPANVKCIRYVDAYWHAVSQIMDLSGQCACYPTVTQLAKAILIIPHGNADTERLFSHVGLNKTKHRNSLALTTLNSLLTVQFNKPVPCYSFKPSNELTRLCKNAVAELEHDHTD